MQIKLRPFIYLTLTMLTIVSTMLLSVHTRSTAQSPEETVDITLLLDQDNLALTIRIDGEAENLDLTSMNITWVNGEDTLEFHMGDLLEIQNVLQNMEQGDCVQLFANNPVPFNALCTGTTTSAPIRPNQVFWNAQDVSFTVYQDSTEIKSCSTITADPCDFEWQIPSDSASTDPNITLIVSNDSLTFLIISEDEMSLEGLELRVVNEDGEPETYVLEGYFGSLRLTENIAQPNDCYILETQDSDDTPPDDCDRDGLFRHALNDADVFWYDSINRSKLDIVILNQGEQLARCSAEDSACEFYFGDVEFTEPTITPSPIPSQPTIILNEQAVTVEEFGAFLDTVTVDGVYNLDLLEDYLPPDSEAWFAENQEPSVSNTSDLMTNMTWYEAAAYCHWKGGMLPTLEQLADAIRENEITLFDSQAIWTQSVVEDGDPTEYYVFTNDDTEARQAAPDDLANNSLNTILCATESGE